MSSLGYQWILEQLLNAGFAVERAFLPDDLPAWKASNTPLLTLETETPVGEFPVIGVSLAYELELAGLIECLKLAGIPPLREDRNNSHPRILLGGPLTFSNPLPAANLVDAMLLGEAEEVVVPAMQAAFMESREEWLNTVQSLPGGYVPERDGTAMPEIAKATDSLLPARSHILSPLAELSNMFLLEGERGCHRTCTFCVMRRSTNGGMRLVSPDRVVELVPEYAPKVGLVGAAISDHPQLLEILERLVAQGKGLGISSLRADRVARKPRIAELLRAGGYRTLTVASDAASQRLRRSISKGTIERHLLECAEIAAANHYSVLKIYMMVGVPEETDEDIDELIRFTRELASIHKIALGIAPFVPKRNTPLDTALFAGISTVEKRLSRLRKGLSGVAEVRPTSARWAWVEAELAQGGPEWGNAVVDAVAEGGRFSDYKREFKALKPARRAPWRTVA
ncbi:MAG: radical SAM protein [Myxococcota bacterium]|nr:radical SAM protein [Myxococcota bacterium]